MTVNGWRAASDLGLTLPHEHALANFQGYEAWSKTPAAYDHAEVSRIILPRLLGLRRRGVRTFVDVTATHLGRDPRLLKMLADQSGLHIITVTGNYAAFDGKFLPASVHDETIQAIANRWIREFEAGIDGTAIKPGLIKLGFNGTPLSQVEQKLIGAAAQAHLRTGLTIAAHTGPAIAAFEQLEILKKAGVHPSAWIWVHAQNEPNLERQIEAARSGAWISFDGIDEESTAAHSDAVARMRSAGLLDHVLISQDAGWYNVGEKDGGKFRSYETIFTHFLPELKKRGFTEAEIHTLLVRNPARALTVNRRATGSVRI